MENVIITGADGFVGSYTTRFFLEQGVQVLALGRGKEAKHLQPHDGLTYMQCDIADADAMRKMIPQGVYDTMIHFAWTGSAGEQRSDLRLQLQNVWNAVECVKTAKELGCSRFVGAGSIMEYEAEAAVHGQESRPSMGYIYGMAKQTAHSMCKAVAARLGIELLWPMITNAYGVGETSPRFINTTLRKIINGEPLRFTAATQNYDFVYVTDVARAFYLIAKNGRPFCEYMIGSSHARPLREFIEEMQQAVAPEAELQFGEVPFTGIDLPLQAFNADAAEKDCGFRAETSFAEGVTKTMCWLKAGERGTL